MKKQVSAIKAYGRYTELKNKPVKILFINSCPDCLGSGKINKKDCSTCGNEPDNKEGLTLIRGYWYKS
jgi:DnaJ-class molecular chaperone